MYSARIIERSLAALERQWAEAALQPRRAGFSPPLPAVKPTYHSIPDARQAVDHFDEKLRRAIDEFGEKDAESKLQFDIDELVWMRNERALAMADYAYYATRYVHIMDGADVVLMNPNLPQKIFNDVRAKIQDLGWAIQLQYLKARQVGGTTDAQGVVSHRTMFYPNTAALVGSSDKDKSALMMEKYRLIYDHMPFWMRPDITRDRAGSFMFFGEMNSSIVQQHGRQMGGGIGRGQTPRVVHLSELASFDDPEKLIEADLFPAIHEAPDVLLILESTAEGPHNWWHETWLSSKEHYWEGRARLCPIFIPWFVRFDFYPTITWLRQRPVPVDWEPEPKTIAHAERARKHVRASDNLRPYFPENWQMPKEQMWFWETTREEARKKGTLDVFQREMCADDNEAFTASGKSVFDVEVISAYNDYCEEPKFVFGFKGPLVPARLHPHQSEIDQRYSPIKLARGYELVPLKWRGWTESAAQGRLLCWHWPEAGYEYLFGVDTGDGVGLNYTALEGLRAGTATENDLQVCELYSPYINAEDLAPLVHATALFYQTAMGRQPRLVIEVARNGELTQLWLRQAGWSNFHKWVRYDRKELNVSKANRVGFVTNCWSRPMLMDKLTRGLRDGSIDINSKEFVREMQALHRDEDDQDARAVHGGFDDCIMAFGMAYFSAHILEFSGKAQSLAVLRQSREQTTVMYRPPPMDDNVIEMPVEGRGDHRMLGEPFERMIHPGATDFWEAEDYGT